MNKVDVNYKIWNCKAKTHFFIHSGILAALALTYLAAFFDYANLPRDVPSEVRRAVFTKFVLLIPLKFAIAIVYLFLLLCPNQIWYGICMAFEATYICYRLFITTISLIGYGITRTYVAEEKSILKYYTCGLIADVFIIYGTILCGVYLCWILFEMSFLYSPQRSSELYVVRVTSPTAEQATDIAIDSYGNSFISRAPLKDTPPEDEKDSEESDSDEHEKSRSGKSQKSRKSQKSQKSRNGKENSSSSKKSKNKKESSSKSRRSKSSKSNKSVESLKSEESIKYIAI